MDIKASYAQIASKDTADNLNLNVVFVQKNMLMYLDFLLLLLDFLLLLRF